MWKVGERRGLRDLVVMRLGGGRRAVIECVQQQQSLGDGEQLAIQGFGGERVLGVWGAGDALAEIVVARLVQEGVRETLDGSGGSAAGVVPVGGSHGHL